MYVYAISSIRSRLSSLLSLLCAQLKKEKREKQQLKMTEPIEEQQAISFFFFCFEGGRFVPIDGLEQPSELLMCTLSHPVVYSVVILFPVYIYICTPYKCVRTSNTVQTHAWFFRHFFIALAKTIPNEGNPLIFSVLRYPFRVFFNADK